LHGYMACQALIQPVLLLVDVRLATSPQAIFRLDRANQISPTVTRTIISGCTNRTKESYILAYSLTGPRQGSLAYVVAK